MKYKVLVNRIENASALIEVETDSTDEDVIRDLAVDLAGDADFSGYDAEYEAHEIEKVEE